MAMRARSPMSRISATLLAYGAIAFLALVLLAAAAALAWGLSRASAPGRVARVAYRGAVLGLAVVYAPATNAAAPHAGLVGGVGDDA